LFNAQGHLKNIKTLPPEVRAALASAEVVRTNMVSGDGLSLTRIRYALLRLRLTASA